MTRDVVAILCWCGLMAYVLGSLYLALFKGVIYLIPDKWRTGSVRKARASDYPREFRAQIVVLTVMLAVLVIGAIASVLGWATI
jgi:hypothetical protein